MLSEGINAGSWIADQVRNDKLLRRVLSRYIFIAKNSHKPIDTHVISYVFSSR